MKSRADILKRVACFRCGMRLNKKRCPYGCDQETLRLKRNEALRIMRNVAHANRLPAIFLIGR